MTRAGSMRCGRWGLTGVALLLCGCQTQAPMEVKSGFGPGVDYQRFGSTFAWSSETNVGRDARRALNPSLDELIRQTVTDDLVAHGYKLQPGEKADFLVNYGVVVRSYGDTSWSPVVYKEGSLIIDVLDGRTHRRVWRGSATARLNESNPPPTQKERIQEAVRRILEGFPKAAAR
jgi:hypothetical protein